MSSASALNQVPGNGRCKQKGCVHVRGGGNRHDLRPRGVLVLLLIAGLFINVCVEGWNSWREMEKSQKNESNLPAIQVPEADSLSFLSPAPLLMVFGCLRASRILPSSRQHLNTKKRTKHSWRPKVNAPSSTMMSLTVEGTEDKDQHLQTLLLNYKKTTKKRGFFIRLPASDCCAVCSQRTTSGSVISRVKFWIWGNPIVRFLLVAEG